MRVPVEGGRCLQVRVSGATDGPVVLFLPGCPDSRWASWPGDPVAAHRGVRLVSVNRPGYGASTPYASTPVTVADDLRALVDALGAEEVLVLGMSVGGLYALAFAARHPSRVAGVATVSAPGEVVALDPPQHRDGLDGPQRTLLARVAGAATAEEAAELLRPEFEAFVATVDPDDTDDEALADRWDGPGHELAALVPRAVLARSAREALGRTDGYLRDAAAMLRRWDVDLGAVRCPVQVHHGSLDTAASPRNAHWLVAHVSGASMTVVDGASHLGALHGRWGEVLDGLVSPR